MGFEFRPGKRATLVLCLVFTVAIVACIAYAADEKYTPVEKTYTVSNGLELEIEGRTVTVTGYDLENALASNPKLNASDISLTIGQDTASRGRGSSTVPTAIRSLELRTDSYSINTLSVKASVTSISSGAFGDAKFAAKGALDDGTVTSDEEIKVSVKNFVGTTFDYDETSGHYVAQWNTLNASIASGNAVYTVSAPENIVSDPKAFAAGTDISPAEGHSASEYTAVLSGITNSGSISLSVSDVVLTVNGTEYTFTVSSITSFGTASFSDGNVAVIGEGFSVKVRSPGFYSEMPVSSSAKPDKTVSAGTYTYMTVTFSDGSSIAGFVKNA